MLYLEGRIWILRKHLLVQPQHKSQYQEAVVICIMLWMYMLKREKGCFTGAPSTVENVNICINAGSVIKARHSQWHLSWTTTEAMSCLFANTVWLISGDSWWWTLHSWALQILRMAGKAGLPLPNSHLISKNRVQNASASLTGSQWGRRNPEQVFVYSGE